MHRTCVICFFAAFLHGVCHGAESYSVVAADFQNRQLLQVTVTTNDGKTVTEKQTVPMPFAPSSITRFADGKRLVVSSTSTGDGDDGSPVAVIRVEDGKLQVEKIQAGQTSVLKHPTGYSSVDRSGKFFLFTNYRSGIVGVHRITDDGGIGEQVSVTNTPRVESHCILTTPDNRFVYVPCVKNNNAIYQYGFDDKTGRLSPLEPFDALPPAMFGPRHVAYHPKLPIAYFSNEQQLGVSVYGIGADGQLSGRQHATSMPRRSPYEKGKRGLHASDLVLSPDGSTLYLAVRDFVGDEDSVFSFRVEADGRLSQVARTKVGDIPWKLDLSPDGKQLLVSESGDQRLSVFHVHDNGTLTKATDVDWGASVRDMVVVPTKPTGNAQSDRFPKPEMRENYRPYIRSDRSVVIWYGRRVALVLDEDDSVDQRDPATMRRILTSMDDIFDAYDRVTGRRPRLTAPMRDRIRIEVSSKVGGGLAHHGRLGVAVGQGFFDGLYKRFDKRQFTVDQVFFYEIARNYWMADMNPSIDYHTSKGPADYGWWTVGFNNAMSIFLPAEIESIDDMFYFGSGGKRFSDGMEANLNTYLSQPDKYNWDNSWNVPLVPWKERTSVNDLMTGLLIRLHRDHGGIEFIRRLYEEIPKREPLASRSDRQGARDNFYEAASLAAQKDLFEFFSKELRWQISEERSRRVAEACAKFDAK